jgi:biopolymer transport protein ExbD
MSDVAFLLLIFIMLVSLINYHKEVPIAYPEAQAAGKVSGDHNLEIWVDKAGALYLNGNPANLDKIQDAVIDAYQKAPDTKVQVIADKSTSFKNVEQVLSILQLLQYRAVSFVVKD